MNETEAFRGGAVDVEGLRELADVALAWDDGESARLLTVAADNLERLRAFFDADHAVLLALAAYGDAHGFKDGPMVASPELDALVAAYARQREARDACRAAMSDAASPQTAPPE